jgi:hypothetical protein
VGVVDVDDLVSVAIRTVCTWTRARRDPKVGKRGLKEACAWAYYIDLPEFLHSLVEHFLESRP